MGCLNCGKELRQIEGKRAKKFCNSTCRSNFWQKQQVIKRGSIKSAKIKKENGNTFAEIKIEVPTKETIAEKLQRLRQERLNQNKK